MPIIKSGNLLAVSGQNATLASPWTIGSAGKSETVAGPDKVRQFLETFLFTVPGERLNRPNYGAGVASLIFGGAPQVEQTLRHSIQGGLGQEMMDLIDVQGVESQVVDSTIQVTIRYRLRQPGAGNQNFQETFERPV